MLSFLFLFLLIFLHSLTHSPSSYATPRLCVNVHCCAMLHIYIYRLIFISTYIYIYLSLYTPFTPVCRASLTHHETPLHLSCRRAPRPPIPLLPRPVPPTCTLPRDDRSAPPLQNSATASSSYTYIRYRFID